MLIFNKLFVLLLLLLLVGCGAFSTTQLVATPTILPRLTVAPPTPQPFALLFASDRDGAGALYLQPEKGELTRLPISVEAESAWEPAISPDGQRILFTGRRSGQSDIALVTAQGEQLEWLTFHAADDNSPAWSWDGSQVAWVSERAGRGHVWVMPVGREGEVEPRRLPSAHEDRQTRNPAWAPDGTLYLSAVDNNNTEELYHYDPATGAITLQTFWPYKGTQPAVSASGEVAFVGWEENPPWRGLYRLRGDDEDPELLWQTTDWIGNPAWSADGAWILFTRWHNDGGTHDLWALPATGGEPQRVTADASWEADAAPWPTAITSTVPPFSTVQTISRPENIETHPGARPLMAGFNVANISNAYLSRDMGFGWAKGFAFWERIEEEPGEYDWREVDNTIEWFEHAGLNIFLRVDRTPTWARPPDTIGSHPPIDLDAFARYLEALATRYRGRVDAYELWNEPNLSFEWGWQAPDPAYYVELLRVARPAIQRGDPDAKLIVGALAVTQNSDRSMNDLEWMEQFYKALGDTGTPARHTAPRLYDAFSTHPYGFGHPPDYSPDDGVGLRHLEKQRALMEAHGDFSPMWLTELGYARQTPGWDLGEHAIGAVSDDIQAQYVFETLDWIEQQYDFVDAVFFFNLDFSTVDWYSASEQMRAYAFLDSTRRPLPVFSRLRERWLANR